MADLVWVYRLLRHFHRWLGKISTPIRKISTPVRKFPSPPRKFPGPLRKISDQLSNIYYIRLFPFKTHVILRSIFRPHRTFRFSAPTRKFPSQVWKCSDPCRKCCHQLNKCTPFGIFLLKPSLFRVYFRSHRAFFIQSFINFVYKTHNSRVLCTILFTIWYIHTFIRKQGYVIYIEYISIHTTTRAIYNCIHIHRYGAGTGS